MSSKNSFPQIAEQVLNYNNNTLNLLSQLNSLLVSNNESVKIDFTDQNNVTSTFEVPSWGYLQSEITRLNNNINSLFAINENGALVETSDNIFRKVILSDLNQEPNGVEGLNRIEKFQKEENNFFDEFLNPSLNINLNLNDKLDNKINEVLVRRYIVEFERNSNSNLTTDGRRALNLFNTLYRGQTDIQFENFIEFLSTTPGIKNPQSPKYIEEIIPLKKPEVVLIGNFSVLSIDEDPTNNKLFYKLNTLEYRVNKTGEVRNLKQGDKLIINRPQTSTIYQVKEVNTNESNPRVVLERIQGNETIPVGEGTIKIYSEVFRDKNIKIKVGYQQRCVLFIKPVNGENNVVNSSFSGGLGFFTSNLSLRSNDSDNGKTMDQFYVEKVDDYGRLIKELSETKKPISLGLSPDAPSLNRDNFKVVQINKHITDNSDKKELVQKYSKLKEVKSELDQIDQSISSKKKQSRLANFKSPRQSKVFDNEIIDLSRKKQSSSNLLKTVTDEIISISNSPNSVKDVKPKYRVRGFWNIPEPKLNRGTREQEVVQFEVQYRYLNKNGNENQTETFNVTNSDGSTQTGAAFSNWETFKTDVRKRVYDRQNDIFRWEVVDVSDADTPNINQLDIPITNDERVEVRVKSISEVGYPEAPLESQFSNIITIDFPEDLSSIVGEDEFILQEASKEDTIVSLKNSLNNVDQHLNDEITVGEESYFHGTDKILSLIPDSEGNQQSLLNYLRNLENKIKNLEEKIERTKGELEVYFYRDDEEFLVKNNQELNFNVECEDYLDDYNEDPDVSGRVYRNNIYTIKDFYMKIENSSNQSPLGLLSNRNYQSDNKIFNSNAPQVFFVNDRDELITNNSSGRTKTQLNNQYIWSVNFDSNSSDDPFNKLSDNIGNDFINQNSNSVTNILSQTEYNLGYGENEILEFIDNNNSLIDVNKWSDETPNVESSSKLLTTIHPSVQNLEDLVETNEDKTKTFQPQEELIVPINIYFKMNSLNPNEGSGKGYDYIDLNKTSSTTRHIKKVKFFIEDESKNNPFIFKVKFNINRSKVSLQKLSQSNKITRSSQFKFKSFNN